MTVDWSQVGLVVFDLDGTLYDQRPVRTAMARALVGASIRERSMRTARILQVYRRTGEDLPAQVPDDFSAFRLRQTASRCAVDEGLVSRTVDQWMQERPLALLRRHRVEGLGRVVDALRASGRKIAVWSDYPVTRKLASLGIEADMEAWTGDGTVQQPKPDPQGLHRIIATLQARPRNTLVIGDRFDRDWQAARSLNVPALMRSRRPDMRAPTFWRYTDPVFAPLLSGA